ncbi:hypothetical protein [Mycoplasmopsis lipofaciens]|uniref:hypothetical protein n=1 Tax=Mycoplasmopsis lipofaciens TaxID=114884 RepID=UPI00146FB17D|nr:hypothetical protein [Mycoplasmopsis lipofaciens]
MFGKIVKVNHNGLTVLTSNSYVFFIPKKNITDWSKKNLMHEFRPNEKINFIIEDVDHKCKKGVGNFKINHAIYQRSLFESKLLNTKHGFNNLKKAVELDIKISKIINEDNK